MWDLCGLSLLSWRKFWIRAIISTGFKILFYRIIMKNCSTLQITGKTTNLRLYSKLDLGWCPRHGDLQPLLTRYLPFRAPAPWEDILQPQPFSGTASWHYYVIGNLDQHQSLAGLPQVPRNRWRYTTIQLQSKTIRQFSQMARQFVTMLIKAGTVTCAISVLAWHSREIYLETVQAVWNKLQLLMSTPIVKYSHWSG